MPDSVDRFIELATGPLAGDDSLRAAAAGDLRERIATHGEGREADLDAAVAILADAALKPGRGRWQLALVGVMLAVSLPMLGVGLKRYLEFRDYWRSWSFGPTEAKTLALLERPLKGPEAKAKLLLGGNPAAKNSADRWRPLWESEPDNPAFLAKYALAASRKGEILPPEILAAAERIDPDNGWFLAVSASGLAEAAVENGKRTVKETREGKLPFWRILDEAKLLEAVELIHRAAIKPEFKTHYAELYQREVAVLPEPTDWVSTVGRRAVMGGSEGNITVLRHDGEALAAAAKWCAARRDLPGFKRTLADWLWLGQIAVREARTVIGQLLARSIAIGNLPYFRDAARELGMTEEADLLAALYDDIRREREVASEHPVRQPNEILVRQRGAFLAAETLYLESPWVKRPPPLAEADVRPGRLMDHALLDRLFAGALWLLLGLWSVIAVWHFREPAVRRLAPRIVAVLRVTDWCWIIAGGVLVPVAWFVAVTRFMPLTAREWSLRLPGFVVFSSQHLALALLLLLAPIALARWRVGLRAAMLGMAGRGLWVDGLAIALLLTALPGMGWAVGNGIGDRGIVAGLVAWFGMPLLWLLVLAVKFVIVSGPHALCRTVVGRAALPAWVFAMLLCGIALPIHHAEERYWTQRERVMALPLEAPGENRYEAMLVPVLRAETLERLKPLEALGGRR